MYTLSFETCRGMLENLKNLAEMDNIPERLNGMNMVCNSVDECVETIRNGIGMRTIKQERKLMKFLLWYRVQVVSVCCETGNVKRGIKALRAIVRMMVKVVILDKDGLLSN